ncbi:7510_t:CDS:2 [Rhizophagus irregularis]|nr:7510_t:CDS:2 [Rhizophagus irregularis]
MFTSINQKLEEYLLPAILKLQRDEIHQYVFYNTIQVSQEVIDKFEDISDAYQITAACMISDINKDQISSIKFEAETTHIIPQHTIPFLIAIYETSQDFITQHEQLSDIQLYGKIAGLTHKVTMKAVKKRDIHIVHLGELLEKY